MNREELIKVYMAIGLTKEQAEHIVDALEKELEE